MDPCKSDLNRSHQCVDESSAQQLLSPLAAPDPPAQTTKIIDLNDDCLAKIFNDLDLVNLFNVALANEWLRPAAADVYKRKFGSKTVRLRIFPSRIHGLYECDFIEISDLKLCLQFLRCFGSSICDLTLRYRWTGVWSRYIHEYVNKYCANSLVNITFEDKSYGPISHFDKPFVAVQSVTFCGTSQLGNQLSSFAGWFPNVCVLKLCNVWLDMDIEMPSFQHLTHLEINIKNDERRSYGFTANGATRLLYVNRQLHSLAVSVPARGISMVTMLNAIKTNRSIRNLTVSMGREQWLLDAQAERLTNEHPTLIQLDLTAYKVAVATAMLLMRRLSSLTMLCFQIDKATEYDRLVRQLGDQWQSLYRNERCSHIVTLNRNG